MENLQNGFYLDDRLVAWGTTLAEVSRLLGFAFDDGGPRGERSAHAVCDGAYGFKTLGVELTAPGADRPVMRLCYELASPGGACPAPDVWASPISRRLGAPVHASESEPPAYADPADCVRYYASWDGTEASVGLSVYGGLRKVKGGCSAACLWLTWDTVSAARPYLANWLARSAELRASSVKPADILHFSLAMPQQPLFNNDSDASARSGTAGRDAHYALHLPHILPTPEAIAAKLAPRRFALWKNEADGFWCASTRWDSIRHPIGKPLAVGWHDVLPAKGSGFSEIDIDGWTVRDESGSKAIRDAVSALAEIPGITINHIQGYDC